jgi:hypothetical protein
MTNSNTRQAVLTYLSYLPANTTVQPVSIALELRLQPSDINALVIAELLRDEIEVVQDGSIKISSRLRGQNRKLR